MNAKRKEIIRLAQDAVALLRKTEPAMLYERGAGKQEARDEEGTQHRELGFLGKDADPKAECKAGLLQTAQGVLAHHGKNKMAADCYMQAHSHYGRAYDCAMAGDEAGCGEHMEAARKVHAQADGMGMDAGGQKHDPANGQFASSGSSIVKGKFRNDPVTVSFAKDPPFVTSFFDEHTSDPKIKTYLKSKPTEHLKKARQLLDQTESRSDRVENLKKYLDAEISSRVHSRDAEKDRPDTKAV